MPLRYKVPGYVGNALLLLLSLVMIGQRSVTVGILFAALSALNLYLIHKLDWFSRDWLKHATDIERLDGELEQARRRISDLESRSAPSAP